MIILLTIFAFILGALPFSVWTGRRMSGKDIRQFGDHNPGATNVLRSGSRAGYLLALCLDISKGALPIGLSYYVLGIEDWQIVPIAVAPTLGHAFSPFLKGRGGKAVAASFGAWIGLNLWPIPLTAVFSLSLFSLLIKPSGWAVLLSLVTLAAAIAIGWPRTPFLAVLFGQSAILLWKHRHELSQRPMWRWQQEAVG